MPYYIYVLSISCCIFALFFCNIAYHATQTERHDRVLFAFYQLRRDLMQYLLDNLDHITRDEYLSLRRLAHTLDDTIDNFGRYKIFTLNLRKLAKHLRAYRTNTKQIAPHAQANPHIRDLHAQFIGCYLTGLQAYTPWIRSERILRLIFWAYSLQSKAIPQRLRQYILEVTAQIRADAQKWPQPAAA